MKNRNSKKDRNRFTTALDKLKVAAGKIEDQCARLESLQEDDWCQGICLQLHLERPAINILPAELEDSVKEVDFNELIDALFGFLDDEKLADAAARYKMAEVWRMTFLEAEEQLEAFQRSISPPSPPPAAPAAAPPRPADGQTAPLPAPAAPAGE